MSALDDLRDIADVERVAGSARGGDSVGEKRIGRVEGERVGRIGDSDNPVTELE